MFGMHTQEDEWNREKYWDCSFIQMTASERSQSLGAWRRRVQTVRVRHAIHERGREHTRPTQCLGFPFPGADGRTARSIGVVQDITDQTRTEDELHRLSQRLLSLRDEGNRHMARDLHESAGQSLAALKMTSSGECEKSCLTRKELAHELVEVPRSNWRKVLSAKCGRSHIQCIHPCWMRPDWRPRCDATPRALRSRSGIVVTKVDVPKDLGRQSQEIEMTVFRIVQEALVNVHRYSGSRIAKVHLLACENGHIRAEVQDRELRADATEPRDEVASAGWRRNPGNARASEAAERSIRAGKHARTRHDGSRDPAACAETGRPRTHECLRGDISGIKSRGKGERIVSSSNGALRVKAMAGKPYRILIVDDHPVVRRGLKSLLASQPGIEICSEASTGVEAMENLKSCKADLVMLDLTMPEMNGLEVARAVREASPTTDVMVLTMHFSEELAREVLRSGALAYVLKSDADTELLAAVDHVRHRQTFFTGRLAASMAANFLHGNANSENGAPPATPTSALTPREIEVVQLLAEGKGNKQVASTLGVSTRTIESHRNHIMRKMGFGSFSELVRFAVRN